MPWPCRALGTCNNTCSVRIYQSLSDSVAGPSRGEDGVPSRAEAAKARRTKYIRQVCVGEGGGQHVPRRKLYLRRAFVLPLSQHMQYG